MRTTTTTKSLVAILLLLTLGGCTVASASDEAELVDAQEQSQIIGTNDLVPVTMDGANIPAKYAPLIDAFGRWAARQRTSAMATCSPRVTASTERACAKTTRLAPAST